MKRINTLNCQLFGTDCDQAYNIANPDSRLEECPPQLWSGFYKVMDWEGKYWTQQDSYIGRTEFYDDATDFYLEKC